MTINYGILEDLFKDDSVTEIMINGISKIYFEKYGKIHASDIKFNREQDLNEFVAGILAFSGKNIDEKIPYADARLPDGSRVNIIIPPLAIPGPFITIRKFPKKSIKPEDLISAGALSRKMLDFLKLGVESKKNIIVSGGTGSGKTTLLNVLSSFISKNERIVTIEDAAELNISHEHVCALEARAPDFNGQGAVTIRQLLINALRMRPDRIIVGECRGGEALDMLQAMNTGHSGSLTTVHSNSPRDCLKRLETMVFMAGYEIPVKTIREQISSAVNIIVQVERHRDGVRRITNISEITGMEGEVITLAPVYEFKKKAGVFGEFGATKVIPKLVEELKSAGTAVDMSMFE